MQRGKNISSFIQGFEFIFSLNYDLLLYWSIVEANKGERFPLLKDCFNSPCLNDKFLSMAEYQGNKSTLVFYPHGSLYLMKREDGLDYKVKGKIGNELIDAIELEWTKAKGSPLFISEGRTGEKKKEIYSSEYLSRVYHEAIPAINGDLLIYGWSVAEQDKHILDVIPFNKVTDIVLRF